MSKNDQIGWDEVQEAAAKLFNVWTNGSELQWAKDAWGYLTAAGLTGCGTALEATATKLRLVTLARIYEEFCGLAWDENRETPVGYMAEDLEIDPIALGILAASNKSEDFDNAAEEYELRDAALLAVTDSQRPEIFACLKDAYGSEIKLYSRLWHTRADEEDNEGEEFEVTSSSSLAFEYVTNGFRS